MGNPSNRQCFLNFANVLVGRFRGGLGYVNVLASMLFGGCSGSAISDVAGLGPLEMKMMEKGGYGKAFSVALTISSSIQGPIIPPSIPLVLVGAVTGTSIGGLLLGGAIPGMLVGIAQGLVIFFISKKREFPRFDVAVPLIEILKIILGGIPFLLMPFIILGGIIGGVFTPTEASAVAVAYGFLLILVYRRGRLEINSLIEVLIRAGTLSAAILMLSGSSNVFGWILATEKIPDMFVRLLFSITDSANGVLLIINIFLLVWGMFMDSLPAILILVPILFPVAETLHIHPIHFGVLVTFNLVIGLITPPYGAALFTGSIVSRIPIEKIVREMLPFIVASICILLLITYVPGIVMYFPKLLGLDK
ncbi:MAG: TRAP transporter large permease [Deltaproteobacteria bacterium]|nr:TRAP transporter large permease [Deltaproteobacteria bacterium]MBW1961014.1 TRAP transporter large permease [Deltaproteobacteria bacterium]MBW1995563.1 TRAP transporter large permease [Deltaproteobacteria bacterium]MBW2152781.1 TRAP transporter large permease [Deltaproteobacteria bacterium]